MPASPTKYIKRWTQFLPKSERNDIPHNTRGIYALLKYQRKTGMYNVVYIGMAASEKASIKKRLRRHAISQVKGRLWSHFSVFEVWDNISESKIRELEALFRLIYKKDTRANKLNKQKGSKLLNKVREKHLENW